MKNNKARLPNIREEQLIQDDVERGRLRNGIDDWCALQLMGTLCLLPAPGSLLPVDIYANFIKSAAAR
jgi:hypothetical protein